MLSNNVVIKKTNCSSDIVHTQKNNFSCVLNAYFNWHFQSWADSELSDIYIYVSLIDRLDVEGFKGNGERGMWVERIS
jgi:hypothetical protein